MDSTTADTPPTLTQRPLALFAISFASLFAELALIRWIGSEVRVFAYCKNLVLLAAFLGLGWGCVRWARRVNFLWSFGLLLGLILLVTAPFGFVQKYGPRNVTDALSGFSDFQVFSYNPETGVFNAIRRLGFGVFWTAASFFACVGICYPYGQLTGRLFAGFRTTLHAYAWNIAGALAGVLAFTGLSLASAGPAWWFGVMVVLTLPFVEPRKHIAAAAILGGLAAWATHESRPGHEIHWSPYQKLDVNVRRVEVCVNNVGYQSRVPPPDFAKDPTVTRWNMCYLTNGPRPKRVLIVGAGIGNDVATALAAGAEEVVAVEIDREIYEIGTRLNPDKPYDSPRVRAVVDDARHFFTTSQEKFDLIVFSHLDAHTLLSGYTNVRLDNFVYTVESLREARNLLSDQGRVFLTFWAERPWIVDRLHANLTEAFGHEPLTVLVPATRNQVRPLDLVHYFAAKAPIGADIIPGGPAWEGFKVVGVATHETPASTDDWPYLYVKDRSIPFLILIISAVILLCTVGLLLPTLGRPGGTDRHFFFLGAAFLLLEVHNVSKLALLLGTTWWVNTWVISAILVMILLGALVVHRRKPQNVTGLYAALGVSLLVAYFVPLEALSSLPRAATVAASLGILSAPIFFASLIFSVSFSRTTNPAAVLGWNMIGAILGGLLESVAFATGLRSLLLLSLALYALSMLALPRREAAAA